MLHTYTERSCRVPVSSESIASKSYKVYRVEETIFSPSRFSVRSPFLPRISTKPFAALGPTPP